MARLWSSGVELNSITNGEEFTTNSGAALETTNIRSGTYALNLTGVDSVPTIDQIRYQFKASNTSGVFFARVYVKITSNFSVGPARLVSFLNTGLTQLVGIKLNTDGTLELWNLEDNSQIGSDSSAMSTGAWHYLELKLDCTTPGSSTAEAKLDGTSFASGSANLATGVAILRLMADGTGTFYADDIAINDDSGSFQNSYPGAAEIIHLRPNAAGDNTQWTLGPHTDSYADVDEVTPDNATTYIASQDNFTEISEFNLDATPAALESSDTINCVQVGVRFTGDGGDTDNTDFVLRIKAAASGTVEESASIDNGTNAWNTNSRTAPRNYPFTLYDLPGASTTAWTKSDLDTAQIGVRANQNAGWNQEAMVSTLWLLVDHTAGAVSAGSPSWPIFTGNKFWGPRFS